MGSGEVTLCPWCGILVMRRAPEVPLFPWTPTPPHALQTQHRTCHSVLSPQEVSQAEGTPSLPRKIQTLRGGVMGAPHEGGRTLQ